LRNSLPQPSKKTQANPEVKRIAPNGAKKIKLNKAYRPAGIKHWECNTTAYFFAAYKILIKIK